LREHEVIPLTSASDALERLTAGDRFDLILCDLMMPGMTGMDLHEALSTASPANAARIVFLTGGAFTARAQAFLSEVPNARLDKPFDPTSLRRLVAISLENRGAGVERISG
jgi:CheY-like chemotaxis protein